MVLLPANPLCMKACTVLLSYRRSGMRFVVAQNFPSRSPPKIGTSFYVARGTVCQRALPRPKTDPTFTHRGKDDCREEGIRKSSVRKGKRERGKKDTAEKGSRIAWHRWGTIPTNDNQTPCTQEEHKVNQLHLHLVPPKTQPRQTPLANPSQFKSPQSGTVPTNHSQSLHVWQKHKVNSLH